MSRMSARRALMDTYYTPSAGLHGLEYGRNVFLVDQSAAEECRQCGSEGFFRFALRDLERPTQQFERFARAGSPTLPTHRIVVFALELQHNHSLPHVKILDNRGKTTPCAAVLDPRLSSADS